MKLIIGQFNDSYLPITDGVVNTVKNYTYWLNKNYGKAYLITPKFPNYKDDEDFEVIRYLSTKLPFRPPYRIGYPYLDLKVKNKLKNIKFDLLHTHCPFSSGHLALKLAKQKNIPLIATFHTKLYDDFKQVLKSDFLTKIIIKHIINFYEKVDYVWTVNEKTAETLRSYGYTKKIDIMPNGTDFSSNFNYEENNEFMLKTHNISQNDLVFLFVGQHIWQKNLKLIVDALYILKKNNLDYKMFFIGEGYAQKALINQVENYNLTDRVKFLGKISDRNLLKRYFARSELFLFPSIYDNAPIVIREAAALKTPSIVIEGANSQEGIIDGFNGFTCQNDVNSFVEKVLQIVNNRENLNKIGINAQKTLSSSWKEIIDNVGLKYQEIIEKYKYN